MSAALAAAVQNLTLQASCAHCGKEGAALHRCSRCKKAWYCGAECQNAGWKKHKKTCAPPLSLDDIREKVAAAHVPGDWREILKWEGRMDELMEGQSDDMCNLILCQFCSAHSSGFSSTGSQHHELSRITLHERHIDLLGKMERFRDQGEKMCSLATSIEILGRRREAGAWYQKARDVGAAHGFFSVECRACWGLGRHAMIEGRHEEGLDLLRNALAASPLGESVVQWDLPVLDSLIDGLFKKNALDELEPLIQRHREAAQEQSARMGLLCDTELRSLSFRARLHEVPCIWHPLVRGEPQEAAREVRALLDLLRENQTAVQHRAAGFAAVLRVTTLLLKTLDSEVGDNQLIQEVAVQLANLPR